MTYGIVLKKAEKIDLETWLKTNKIQLEITEYADARAGFRAKLEPGVNLTIDKHYHCFKEWSAPTLPELLDHFCRKLTGAETIGLMVDRLTLKKGEHATIPAGPEIVWQGSPALKQGGGD